MTGTSTFLIVFLAIFIAKSGTHATEPLVPDQSAPSFSVSGAEDPDTGIWYPFTTPEYPVLGRVKSVLRGPLQWLPPMPFRRREIPDSVSLVELTPASPGQKIKVLSYNMFIRPPAPRFTHNQKDDVKDQRLSHFIEEHLDRYDVLCLQEVFGAFSGRRDQLIAAAEKKGFVAHVVSPQQRSKGYLVDGGCVILSKFPLVKSRVSIFSRGVFDDGLAAKGVLYAKLRVHSGVHMHVFTTHLQASYPSKDLGLITQVRERQMDQLVAFVRHCLSADNADEASPGDIIMIAGDFNCNSRGSPDDGKCDSDEYKTMMEKLSQLGRPFDLVFQSLGEHPVTYADARVAEDGTLVPLETHLTVSEDYDPRYPSFNRQSIDYIIVIPAHTITSADGSTRTTSSQEYGDLSTKKVLSTEPSAPHLEFEACHVNKFEVESSDPRAQDPKKPFRPPLKAPRPLYTQLSDHFGVEADFQVVLPQAGHPDGKR